MRTFQLVGLAIIPLFLSISVTAELQNASYWKISNKKEVVIFNHNQNITHYFNNNTKQLCHAFKIKGNWQHAEEEGALVSTENMNTVRLFLFSKDGLQKYSGENLISKASNRIVSEWASTYGHPPKASKKYVIHGNKYKIHLYMYAQKLKIDEKAMVRGQVVYFVEIKPGWIAGLSTLTGNNTAKYIFNNFEYTQNPACYWPEIHKLQSKLQDKSSSSSPSFVH